MSSKSETTKELRSLIKQTRKLRDSMKILDMISKNKNMKKETRASILKKIVLLKKKLWNIKSLTFKTMWRIKYR